MATAIASPLSAEAAERGARERGGAVALVTALTLATVAIHGYHPYAEDGGLYLPEIKRLLRPELYPHGTEFVVGHLQFSVFAPLMAALIRLSHLGVETVMLMAHLLSLWMTLFAAWLLAVRFTSSRKARCGAVALLAVWMALPIAGTSLMLMDPYVTARSFSTPCGLLALVGALGFLLPQDGVAGARRRGLWLCCGALVAGAAMHPLMGAYALGATVLLGCLLSADRRIRIGGTFGLCVAAIGLAGMLTMAAVPESTAYGVVTMSRYYWFLSQWQWYELVGLAAPLAILGAVGFGSWRVEGQSSFDAARVGLTRMATVAGTTAVVVAALFAREGRATHLVARLQPLRIFQLVYVVMILVVGATLGERVLQRSVVRWVAVFSLLAGVMVYVERQTFPASARVELPWSRAGSGPKNPWEQAFVWISRDTPVDALFALDAHYITRPGEDAQGFRAIAERSVLPDYSKDGGVVANKPGLTAEWMAGQVAQAKLNTETDAARIAALRPLGVSWVVLEQSAQTELQCGYANEVVKVCRLP